MGIIKFLKSIFTGERQKKTIKIYLKDNKCGEKIKLVLRKGYDIVSEYGDQKEAAFSIKKMVICNNCYNKIELYIEFDKYYDIINKEIKNGQLLTEEEFYSNS